MAATTPKCAKYSAQDSVALFLPCYIDLLYPHVGKAVLAIFESLGIPLAYPMQQTCCGQPAFNAGYWPEARAAANRFADIFADYSWIVVPSGSCGAMTRVFYEYLESASEAARIGTRVYELSTFLVDVVGVTDLGARFPHRVTYHEGCHARRELAVGQATLQLLLSVRNLELVDLPGIDECCGFGGFFSVKYDELSAAMGDAKCKNIATTRADVLVSGDMSCLMHVGGMLHHRAASAVKVMHLAEILAAR